MIPLKDALNSSLGKKYLMSVSGLAMVGFLVTHLLGNLQLYSSSGEAFNKYAKGLADSGPLLLVAEAGLLVIFLVHVVLAFGLTGKNRSARGSKYAHAQATKGGPSYMSGLSKNMIVTGAVLGVFIVVHVLHMKFGAFTSAAVNAKTVTIHNVEMHDLFARVVDAFKNPAWVAFYVGVMLFLGAHLRHGFWSAFQSLGALNHRLEKPATIAGLLVALTMAAGFLFIPIYIFIMNAGA